MVRKLISCPNDYPRAYICDECIAVCNAILEDDMTTQRGMSPLRHLRHHPSMVTLLRQIEACEQRIKGCAWEAEQCGQALAQIQSVILDIMRTEETTDSAEPQKPEETATDGADRVTPKSTASTTAASRD